MPPPTAKPAAQPAATPTVFVVDDDDGVRESLRWLLESVGHPVRVFRNGREFLDGYDADQPGCLLLDVRMPLMGGFELQEVLRTNNPALPILFLTGHGTIPMSVRAMRSGAFDFIEKPFSDQALLDRVQDAVNRAAELHRQQRHTHSIHQLLALLSPREREVLDLLIDGLSSWGSARRRWRCTAATSAKSSASARWPSWCGWCSTTRSAETSRPARQPITPSHSSFTPDRPSAAVAKR